MGLCKDHLRTIKDPLVDGLVKIADENYAIFPFGQIYDPSILSRVLTRQMPMTEYLEYLSGEKPVVKYEGEDYFVPRPQNYEEIVENYEQTHVQKQSKSNKNGGLIRKIAGMLI
jgi:hypothetical protein